MSWSWPPRRVREITVAATCTGCGVVQTLASRAVLNSEEMQWQVQCPNCCRPITGSADRRLAAALAAGGARRVSRRGVDDVIADETLEALIWPDGDAPVWEQQR